MGMDLDCGLVDALTQSFQGPAAARPGGVLTMVLAPLRAFLGGIARLLVPRFPIV